MKKRTLAALLGTLTALSSVAPTMAQAAENTEEYTVTFCRTQDSTMESDIFSILKDESYEDNRWTRLIADRLGINVKYLWIAPNEEQQTQKFNAAVAAGTIPDIVCVDKLTLKNLVEADLVVDMGSYFEEYASDLLKSMIESAGEQCVQACTLMEYSTESHMLIVILRPHRCFGFVRTGWMSWGWKHQRQLMI